MRTARRIKTPEEVDAIRSALRVAEHGLAAAVAELQLGVTEQALTGAFMEAEAAGGVTTPATQDSAWVTSKDSPWRRAHGDGGVRDGDLVAFDAGVLAGGYVGEVGRTWPVGDFDEDAVERPVPAPGRAVGQAARRLPARRAGQRPARRLRGGRRTAAADAGGPRPRPGLRPAGDHAAPARDRRRGNPRPRNGAGAHRLRLGAGCGWRVHPRRRPRHRGRARGAVRPVRRGRTSVSERLMAESAEQIILYEKDPEDQDRDDHVQPARPAQRADHRGPAPLRRPAAPGQHRRRRQGAGDPRRR